jgi:hypothetical protein
MKIPGSLPIGPSIAARVTRAYGLPGQVAQPKPVDSVEAIGTVAKPAEAVQGLRAILSEDERAYFDQISHLGPITYGPGQKRGMTPDAPRGLRIDVTG